eukprot:gene5289-29409_t
MTTAHRPTWAPALGGSATREGGLGSLSKQTSVKDQAAHTKLKFRQPGQGGAAAAPIDEEGFKAQLLEREAKHEQKRKADKLGTTEEALLEQEQAEKRLKAITAIDPDLDADDDDDGDGSDSDSDSDDDEDDEAELLRELQRIKAERAQEKEEEELAKTAEQEQINKESYMRANPLLKLGGGGGGAASSDFAVDRRWDDDVVFKNCARNTKKDVGFVNDTLRSEFHRKFMSKYIQ